MMPQGDVIGIFMLLMVFITIIFLIPIILFFIMMYKARRNVADWQGILSSDDFKGIVKEQRETSKRFINNLNGMMETWISSHKKKEK